MVYIVRTKNTMFPHNYKDFEGAIIPVDAYKSDGSAYYDKSKFINRNDYRKALEHEVEAFKSGVLNINVIPKNWWEDLKSGDCVVKISGKDNSIPEGYIFKTNHNRIKEEGFINDLRDLPNGYSEDNIKYFRKATKEEEEIFNMVGKPIHVKYVEILEKARKLYSKGNLFNPLSNEFKVVLIKGDLMLEKNRTTGLYYVVDEHSNVIYKDGKWAKISTSVSPHGFSSFKDASIIMKIYDSLMASCDDTGSFKPLKLINPSRKRSKIIKLD